LTASRKGRRRLHYRRDEDQPGDANIPFLVSARVTLVSSTEPSLEAARILLRPRCPVKLEPTDFWAP
jgi:hypothetical protein